MFERLITLIDKEYEKISNLNILLIGIGGVGGYAFECLVRSGIKKITIIDPDKVELSNFNRQIIATTKAFNKNKVDIAKQRGISINKDCHIKTYNQKLSKENFADIIKNDFDFIIDACDDVKTKIDLIFYAKEFNIKLITCLGTANRLDPTKFQITTLNKTYNDPLAKKMRKDIPIKMQNKVKVLWSSELPKKRKSLGTICHVPMTAGALLAAYTLNSTIKKD